MDAYTQIKNIIVEIITYLYVMIIGEQHIKQVPVHSTIGFSPKPRFQSEHESAVAIEYYQNTPDSTIEPLKRNEELADKFNQTNDDIDDYYFEEDDIDIIAEQYNFKTHNKYNIKNEYSTINDFHRGKASNAKKKSKRSVSSFHIPDGYDRYEEKNAYFDVSFHNGKLIYY